MIFRHINPLHEFVYRHVKSFGCILKIKNFSKLIPQFNHFVMDWRDNRKPLSGLPHYLFRTLWWRQHCSDKVNANTIYQSIKSTWKSNNIGLVFTNPPLLCSHQWSLKGSTRSRVLLFALSAFMTPQIQCKKYNAESIMYISKTKTETCFYKGTKQQINCFASCRLNIKVEDK